MAYEKIQKRKRLPSGAIGRCFPECPKITSSKSSDATAICDQELREKISHVCVDINIGGETLIGDIGYIFVDKIWNFV